MKRRFLLFLFRFSAIRLATGMERTVANRKEISFTGSRPNILISIIRRDTSKPDMYSREEIFDMLKRVRCEEQRMQWKCPEPFQGTKIEWTEAKPWTKPLPH
jgi:hypothetical protein